MRIGIFERLDKREVLAGSLLGRQLLGALIPEVQNPEKPELCFLDFGGVAVATASFLRDGVIAYRDYARAHLKNLYPVIANPSEAVTEELNDLLRTRGDTMVACSISGGEIARQVRLLGRLESKQLKTLHAVILLGEVDAAGLATRYGDEEDIKPTAWNNRLSALAAKGLLIEKQRGRTKLYRPVLEGLQHGT